MIADPQPISPFVCVCLVGSRAHHLYKFKFQGVIEELSTYELFNSGLGN